MILFFTASGFPWLYQIPQYQEILVVFLFRDGTVVHGKITFFREFVRICHFKSTLLGYSNLKGIVMS